MGWITARNLSGDHVGGRRKGKIPKDTAPLRRIVGTIRFSTGLFDTAIVELECGHTTHSNGIYRARCLECKAAQDSIERQAGAP